MWFENEDGGTYVNICLFSNILAQKSHVKPGSVGGIRGDRLAGLCWSDMVDEGEEPSESAELVEDDPEERFRDVGEG